MDLWVDIAFAVLLRTIKNERLARQLKSAFLKLYLAIGRAYANDPEFIRREIEPKQVGQ